MASGPSTGLDKRLESIRKESNAMRFPMGSDDAIRPSIQTLSVRNVLTTYNPLKLSFEQPRKTCQSERF